MPSADDERLMRRAIELAGKGHRRPGGAPIGCVLVAGGEIVAEAHNEVELRSDPTAHAEIVALRRLGETRRAFEFRDVTLYSTLQPCGMCTMASVWAKVARIVYGAGRGDVHSMYFEDRHLDTVDFIKDAFRDDMALEGGVLLAECAGLYPDPDEPVPLGEQPNR